MRKSSRGVGSFSKRPAAVVLAGIGMAAVLVIVVVLVLAQSGARHTNTAAAPRDAAAGAANAPAPAVDPCQGFTGDLVTSQDGDQTSPLEVVAALEYAFYVKRDPAAVIALYMPGVLAGDAKAGIADFVAHIPAGTRYCVAATTAGANAVNYDVRDIRPDPDSRANAVPITKSFAMTLTVTPSAPYFISTLHTRK